MSLDKGFRPEEVEASINGVQTAYDSLMDAIATQMQNQFVNGMQDKWACNQAIKFFGEFKTIIDSIITNSNITFESVVESMNSAARLWAERTETSWGGKSFNKIEQKINVECIQENIANERGIDTTATTVSAKLPEIAASAEQALTAAQKAVSECGFIDVTESGNLQQSLEEIKTSITNATTDLTDSCKNAIDSTVEQYTEVSNRIATAFAGQ